MDLIFDFDRCQGITNARFNGLDGSEPVMSVKEALNLMKIRNPSIVFSEAVHDGAYNSVPDAEYKRMLDTIKYISTLTLIISNRSIRASMCWVLFLLSEKPHLPTRWPTRWQQLVSIFFTSRWSRNVLSCSANHLHVVFTRQTSKIPPTPRQAVSASDRASRHWIILTNWTNR